MHYDTATIPEGYAKVNFGEVLPRGTLFGNQINSVFVWVELENSYCSGARNYAFEHCAAPVERELISYEPQIVDEGEEI